MIGGLSRVCVLRADGTRHADGAHTRRGRTRNRHGGATRGRARTHRACVLHGGRRNDRGRVAHADGGGTRRGRAKQTHGGATLHTRAVESSVFRCSEYTQIRRPVPARAPARQCQPAVCVSCCTVCVCVTGRRDEARGRGTRDTSVCVTRLTWGRCR
eukprot:7006753-Prymnesium_polylepis.1